MRAHFVALNFTDGTVSIANSIGQSDYLPPSPPTPAPESKSSLGLILGLSIGGIILIIIVVVLICKCTKKDTEAKRRNNSILNEDTMTEDVEDHNLPLNVSESRSMLSTDI